MKKIKGKMFSDDGVKTQLSDLLDNIPDNNWCWSLYEFTGVGEAPAGLAMPEFEALVLSQETGFSLTWPELKSLSLTLLDISDCFLAAVTSPVAYHDIDSGDLTHCLALIKISDSTSWEIGLIDEL